MIFFFALLNLHCREKVFFSCIFYLFLFQFKFAFSAIIHTQLTSIFNFTKYSKFFVCSFHILFNFTIFGFLCECCWWKINIEHKFITFHYYYRYFMIYLFYFFATLFNRQIVSIFRFHRQHNSTSHRFRHWMHIQLYQNPVTTSSIWWLMFELIISNQTNKKDTYRENTKMFGVSINFNISINSFMQIYILGCAHNPFELRR